MGVLGRGKSGQVSSASIAEDTVEDDREKVGILGLTGSKRG